MQRSKNTGRARHMVMHEEGGAMTIRAEEAAEYSTQLEGGGEMTARSGGSNALHGV